MAAADPKPGPFAQEMKRRRELAGLDQSPAARRCGVGPSRWRQVELGYQIVNGIKKATEPSSDFVIRVARGFRWDVDEALKLAGYDPKSVVIPEEREVTVPATLADMWPQMNKAQQQELINLASLFVDPETIIEPVTPPLRRSAPPAGTPQRARKRTPKS